MKNNVFKLILFWNLAFSLRGACQDFSPGLYSGRESRYGPTGLYLFRPDSTLLFFGIGTDGAYTTFEGKWVSKGRSLKYSRIVPSKSIRYLNGAIEYSATTKASFDSIYYDIEIFDTDGKPITTVLKLSNKSEVTILNGKLRTAISNCCNPVTILQLNGGNIPGSFYSIQVPLSLGHNSHKLRIKVERFSKDKPFLPLTQSIGAMITFDLKKISEGVYKSDESQFKRLTDISGIQKSFIDVRISNPSFKPYFDWLENEFKSNFQIK